MRSLEQTGKYVIASTKVPWQLHVIISQLSADWGMPPLTLHPSRPDLYSKLSDTRGRQGICLPSTKTGNAIDAVMQPATGVHITHSQCQPLNGDGIRAWMGCLQSKENASILFCVPEGLYSTYPKQDLSSLIMQEYPIERRWMCASVNVPADMQSGRESMLQGAS